MAEERESSWQMDSRPAKKRATADLRTLLLLFGEMAFLAAFVIGGGYVILSVADERFSTKRKWIRAGELFEMLPLFQMIPGIIGGHTAVYLGNRVAGPLGALVASAGIMLPSVVIFLAISVVYRSIPIGSAYMAAVFLGLRAALTGVLAEMVVRTWRRSVSGVFGYLVCPLAVLAMIVGKVSPALVIVAGMLAGLAVEFLRGRPPAADADGAKVFRSFWAIPLLFVGYGLMAFGGGFVLVPVYMRDFVGETARFLQLAPADFANIMALTEMTPGPVAANCATFFGFRLGGVAGALVATASLLLPGAVILYAALRSLDRFRSSVVVRGILRGVRPVTSALLFCATWAIAGMSVWRSSSDGLAFSPLACALAVATFLLVATKRLGAVLTIVLSALASLLASLLMR